MSLQNCATLPGITTQTSELMDAITCVVQRKSSLFEINLDEYKHVITTGCGSTDFLSLTAANIIQSINRVVSKALPSSSHEKSCITT